VSQTGLLPSRICQLFLVKSDLRYMEVVVGWFHHGLGRFGEIAEETTESDLQSRLGIQVSICNLENILCKIYLVENETNNLKFFLLFPGQNIFVFDKDMIKIYDTQIYGEKPQESTGCFINSCAYNMTLRWQLLFCQITLTPPQSEVPAVTLRAILSITYSSLTDGFAEVTWYGDSPP
jgi:hypothetical protein